MNSFSKFILRLVGVTIAAVLILQYVLHRGEFSMVRFIVFAIALAVGVIPEALPLVITTALSRGALKLAKCHVVPKRLSAIEDLGNIDVLCTDKTGTITENHLKVEAVIGKNMDEILRYALAASAFIGEKESQPNNSFDMALWEKASAKIRAGAKKLMRLADLPFDPERRRNSALVEENGKNLLVVRGAPEELCELCDDFGNLSKDKIIELIKQEGERGRRVLGVAVKEVWGGATSLSKNEEKHLFYLGLVSFIDPLKSSAKRAIHDAEKLGLTVKIITGDSREVAGSVGQSIGLISKASEVITGAEFEALNDKKKRKAVQDFFVFARINPLQKLEIINLLKEKHFVGFLGEGFNDAPALKAAHVALVVENASDIAKDTADIVLLNKSLEVIVDGIKEGRKIFVNSFKYIKTTLISNFGNFYAMVFASLMVRFLPMLPLQILLLNLLSDFPMIAIAADKVDTRELRKPKGYQVKEVVLAASILGLVSTGFDFAFFGYFLRFGERNLQTMWFIGSVITELLLIFSIRQRGWFFKGPAPSGILLWLTAVIIPATLFLPFTKFGQDVFSFVPQSASSIAVGVALALGYFVTTEVVKMVYSKYANHAVA